MDESDVAIPNRQGDRSIVINGRSLTRDQPTGVDQLPALLAAQAERLGYIVSRPNRSGRLITNLWEQSVLPWRARKSVLLSLANSGPLVARNHITMLHDMSPWDHPEWFGRGYRAKALAVGWAWARSCPLILTPSEFSADRAASVLRIGRARFRVVGNAHRWGRTLPQRQPDPDPYVLTVSTLSTRKNLGLILEAWPRVRQRHPDLTLKVAGAVGAPVLADTGEMRDVEGVHYLGYVTEAALDELLTGARVVASASVYEGFNIPLLDAAAIGVPIAASDIAVHRELYSQVGHFFSTTDASTLVDAIELALATEPDPEARQSLAAGFAGDAVVERVVEAVDELS